MNAKGLNFARYALAKAVAGPDAIDFAERAWGRDSKAAMVTKAAVSASSTDSQSALHGDFEAAAAEFLELVRAESIGGRLTGLRRLPHDTPYLRQTGTVSANWVAEGKPMPISNSSFVRDKLGLLKVTAVTVSTMELLEGPDADRILRTDLVAATREALDRALIDPANAGIPDEKPASITNGLTALTGSGTLKTDVEAMVAEFDGDFSRAVFIGSPELFVKMNGNDYPNIGARGGEIAGIPALASSGVPDDGTGNSRLVLLDPGAVVYTGGDTAEIRTTDSATIEMTDTPAGSALPPTEVDLVSLFQVNAKAIGAMHYANWRREQSGGVVLMEGIA